MQDKEHIESLGSQLQDLRQKAIEAIYDVVRNPNMVYHVEVPCAIWLAPDPPCITTLRIVPNEDNPIEGITSEGKHYIDGTVKFQWDEDDVYHDIDELDADTLIDLAEAIENI